MKLLDSLKQEVKSRTKNDSAHDFNHIMRVYKNAKRTNVYEINPTEEVNLLFHIMRMSN